MSRPPLITPREIDWAAQTQQVRESVKKWRMNGERAIEMPRTRLREGPIRCCNRSGSTKVKQLTHTLEIRTRGKGLYPFTGEVAKWVASCNVETGLLTIFCQHTSASLVIQENADPDVVLDLADYFERVVPENDPRYRHTTEGDDDMPAHIRASLTATSLTIPVTGRRMALGTWQGIYLFEHRRSPQRRGIVLHLMGE